MPFSPNIIARQEWGAMVPKTTEAMSHPIQNVLFSAENEFDPCKTRNECTQEVQKIQKHYMDKGLDDMPYNFVIGNDGNVYEGRGWDNKPGPDIQVNEKFRDKVIDIGVICGHEEIIPEKMDMVRDAFKAAKQFVEYGVQEKIIAEDHEFQGFSDEVTATNPK